MNVNELIDRKLAIRALPEPPGFVKQRLAQAAQELSRAGDLAARVELVNESLFHAITMLYERDTDGGYANIDRVTFRLLVPAPWGAAGWKRWGLRRHEATTLRAMLVGRIRHPRHIALFDYSPESRSWFVDVAKYPTVEAAKAYLERNPITLPEWRGYAKG